MSDQEQPTPPASDAESIDGEHRVQIGLIEALEQAVARNAEQGEITQLLEQFRDYTRLHFSSEELLMRLHAYPQHAEHLQEHERLSEDLESIEQAHREGRAETLLAELRAYRSRLMTHIRTLDDQFSRSIT
jgi:hemerythrin-like metal-binding protein